jgi:hypothetical protein
MIAYLILFIVLLLLSLKIKKKKILVFDIILLLVLISFSALRYGIGADYFLYEDIFNARVGFNNYATNRTGIGFSFLMSVLKGNFAISYALFIALIAIVTISCFYYFYKKESKYPGLAIFLFVSLGFYTTSFNAFRQYLSLSLMAFSYSLYKNEKKILSLLFAIASIAIHSSTAILLAGIIACHMIKKNYCIKPKYVLLASIVLFAAYSVIFSKIVGFSDSYAGYESYNSTPGIGTYLMVLCENLIYYLLLVPNRNKLSVDGKRMYNLTTLGIIITSLQLHNWLFVRVAQCFLIFMPITMSDIIGEMNSRNKKILLPLLYVGAMVYFLIYVSSFGGVTPYNSILLKGA